MFHVILYQPEIPPNTGNIIRLCANTGCTLHLIEPLGFCLDEKRVKRAGLDYHAMTAVITHHSLEDCLKHLAHSRVFALTTKGKTSYTTPSFQAEDAFIFGPESKGLGEQILSQFAPHQRLCIPQVTALRSLNLANCVSIMVYEAWRQLDFSISTES